MCSNPILSYDVAMKNTFDTEYRIRKIANMSIDRCLAETSVKRQCLGILYDMAIWNKLKCGLFAISHKFLFHIQLYVFSFFFFVSTNLLRHPKKEGNNQRLNSGKQQVSPKH